MTQQITLTDAALAALQPSIRAQRRLDDEARVERQRGHLRDRDAARADHARAVPRLEAASEKAEQRIHDAEAALAEARDAFREPASKLARARRRCDYAASRAENLLAADCAAVIVETIASWVDVRDTPPSGFSETRVPTGKRWADTLKPVMRTETTPDAAECARWLAALRDAIAQARELRLEPLTTAEATERLEAVAEKVGTRPWGDRLRLTVNGVTT